MKARRPVSRTIPGMTLAALVIFVRSLPAEQGTPPLTTNSVVPDNPSEHPAPVQPIPYSHKKHLALGLDCKTCHRNPEPGKLMTFPEKNLYSFRRQMTVSRAHIHHQRIWR